MSISEMSYQSFSSCLLTRRLITLPGCCRSILSGLLVFFLGQFLCPASARANGTTAQLANDYLQLNLGFNASGIPAVISVQKTKSGAMLLSDAGTGNISAWFQRSFNVDSQGAAPSWATSADDDFYVAQASVVLTKGMLATWIVELARQGSLFRLHVMLSNAGQSPQSVTSYPAWNASWALASAPASVEWWDALTFTGHQQSLPSNAGINLGSQLYSSPVNGTNPFWVVQGPAGNMYFALGWSGGWQASLNSAANVLNFSVGLSSSQTQLVLKPGEIVDGPVLEVMPALAANDAASRRFWMCARAALIKGPGQSIPLIYNSWYAIKRDIDGGFLRNQISAMAPYGFDAMVVDAGWYQAVGDWESSTTKFDPGELAELLASLKSGGHRAGLWSAPQYVSTNNKPAGTKLESPKFFDLFLQAYLLDLWNSNYSNLLTNHVQQLRSQFSVDYWKYDQPIFVDQSRAGAMKDVIAFQNALKTVRAANPDLTIENCMDGGQIINEVTLLNTQLSWLEDGGDNGYPAARTNIQTVMGALEFVFPWSAYRFTNLLEQMDQNDDELTKYYCRSAMMGAWGISSNLALIGDHQQSVILSEIQNYRKLNQLKLDALYDLRLPVKNPDTAGVTFYAKYGKRAGVLVFRWGGQGALAEMIALPELDPKQTYQVTDVDTGASTQMTGTDLTANGLSVVFSDTRQSALVFIDPIDQ